MDDIVFNYRDDFAETGGLAPFFYHLDGLA